MTQFTIAMPFTGVAVRTIEAQTEQEAIAKFMNETTFPTLTNTSTTDAEIEQWDFCEQIVEGNVFYGIQNSVDVTAFDED